jgi:endonuclease/exonuclease/phosphatase family metal-dependent hydrolase
LDHRGDFNIITSLPEKSGGLNRLDQDSDRFKETISDLGLVDWETTNGTFTWRNHRVGQHHIASHLDHFLISESLLQRNYAIEATILPYHGSDHWPINLLIDIPTSPKNRPFHFESFWLMDPSFHSNFPSWWKATISQLGLPDV